MQADTATTTSHANGKPQGHTVLPMCYFCSSTDTMVPFRRESRVFLLSAVIPRLRWRYCRNCRSHFIDYAGKSRANRA